jgi:hypothetical protein
MKTESTPREHTYASARLAGGEFSTPIAGMRQFPWLSGGGGYYDFLKSLLTGIHLVPLSIFAFAICIAPTLVSYEPYSFHWDESEYLWRSIVASRAFWSGNRHDLGMAMRSIRPPIMTFLGVPWGPLSSWDAAGKCFLTLDVFTAILVALCVFLLLRVGLKPLYLMIAGVCVFAALGPFPGGTQAHLDATGLLADSFFAWVAFAAILLIPYEVTTPTSTIKGALWRGVLWGAIFSVGALTKASFLYFIVIVIPVLLIVRARHSGRCSALFSFLTLTTCSMPVAVYWLRYGLPALKNGWAASFGHDAPFYYVTFWEFASETIQRSPGLLLTGIFAIACIGCWAVKGREATSNVNLLPLLITIGYCTLTLSSSNRDLRYSFLGIIATPFLIGILMSGRARVLSRGNSVVAALLVFGFLTAAGVPTLHRADKHSIARSEAVLSQAAAVNAKHILLATDSRTLNWDLMLVAGELSQPRRTVETQTLAYSAANDRPIEDDFRQIRESDMIVFQSEEAPWPAFTNQRASKYEEYAEQHFGKPLKVAGDVRIYCASCAALTEPAETAQDFQSFNSR